MKTKLLLLLSLIYAFSTSVFAVVTDPNQILLPELYPVYTDGTSVLNHPADGFAEHLLPTVNLYKGMPGCYIACYSRKSENSIYSAGDSVFVLGVVRVAGKYNNERICEPTNFAGRNITGDPTFKTICTEKIASCVGGHCWAGGDTGQFFEMSSKVLP